MLPHPEPGLVIRYSFLWSHEAEAQSETARKARPCAIVTSVRQAGDNVIVTVAPITHLPPQKDSAIELPLVIKRSLQLDDERSWIITDELNTFAWPGPDLESIPASKKVSYGKLPRPLTIMVLRAVLEHVRAGRLRIVKRTE